MLLFKVTGCPADHSLLKQRAYRGAGKRKLVDSLRTAPAGMDMGGKETAGFDALISAELILLGELFYAGRKFSVQHPLRREIVNPRKIGNAAANWEQHFWQPCRQRSDREVEVVT